MRLFPRLGVWPLQRVGDRAREGVAAGRGSAERAARGGPRSGLGGDAPVGAETSTGTLSSTLAASMQSTSHARVPGVSDSTYARVPGVSDSTFRCQAPVAAAAAAAAAEAHAQNGPDVLAGRQAAGAAAARVHGGHAQDPEVQGQASADAGPRDGRPEGLRGRGRAGAGGLNNPFVCEYGAPARQASWFMS